MSRSLGGKPQARTARVVPGLSMGESERSPRYVGTCVNIYILYNIIIYYNILYYIIYIRERVVPGLSMGESERSPRYVGTCVRIYIIT